MQLHLRKPSHHAPAPQPVHDRRRALILGTIHTDGTPAVTRTLLLARSGDSTAARMTMGEVLRALPTTDALTANTLLRCAAIDQDTRLGDLTAAQRGSLAHLLSSTDRARSHPQ
ncbi:hypothetical protein [Streptacidiphilus carbonis]|uniref:hypothetical protein n=1 Tax=Streptacidiphilus carbonis TaxID=105422 RepID=UPI0005AB8194|nr:hypothetical protein [Streptacidiphilus carbonis]